MSTDEVREEPTTSAPLLSRPGDPEHLVAAQRNGHLSVEPAEASGRYVVLDGHVMFLTREENHAVALAASGLPARPGTTVGVYTAGRRAPGDPWTFISLSAWVMGGEPCRARHRRQQGCGRSLPRLRIRRCAGGIRPLSRSRARTGRTEVIGSGSRGTWFERLIGWSRRPETRSMLPPGRVYRPIPPGPETLAAIRERERRGEIVRTCFQSWGSPDDPVGRCRHGRAALFADKTDAEESYCLAHMEALRDMIVEYGPDERTFESWGLRWWSGLPDAATLVDCECACECGWYGRLDEADPTNLVFRCPRCVETGHPPVLRSGMPP